MLNDKVVIIAGGAGKIGKAFAEAVLHEKAICILADLDKDQAESIINELRYSDKSRIIEFQKFDITDKKSIQRLIENVVNKYNKIDAFVNSSYPRNSKWGRKFEDVEYDDFCENSSLHLGGYFLAAQQFCIFFKKQGYGNIIQISSIMGAVAPKFDTYQDIVFQGKEMTSPAEYSIFKAGIIHFTKYLAKYYKNCNIRSNCISPGGIFSGQPEQFLNRYKQYCTSKGMLDGQDIAGALIFLLSDNSKYINGQNIIVDDGWSV